MEQIANYAAMKDAAIELRREECALGMEQSLNTSDAVVKDAQVLLRREGCAFDMGQKSNDAASKIALIKLLREDYACGTGQK